MGNLDITFKPQHQDSIFARLVDLKKSINYHKNHITPFYHEIYPWEMREYAAVLHDHETDYDNLRTLICEKEYESIFNQLLSQYNFSVATFVAWVNFKLV